jgi:hypothetical protein
VLALSPEWKAGQNYSCVSTLFTIFHNTVHILFTTFVYFSLYLSTFVYLNFSCLLFTTVHLSILARHTRSCSCMQIVPTFHYNCCLLLTTFVYFTTYVYFSLQLLSTSHYICLLHYIRLLFTTIVVYFSLHLSTFTTFVYIIMSTFHYMHEITSTQVLCSRSKEKWLVV